MESNVEDELVKDVIRQSQQPTTGSNSASTSSGVSCAVYSTPSTSSLIPAKWCVLNCVKLCHSCILCHFSLSKCIEELRKQVVVKDECDVVHIEVRRRVFFVMQ